MINGVAAFNNSDKANKAENPYNLRTDLQDSKNKIEDKTPAGEKSKDINEIKECQTCNNRRYQDGSNDPGVSFKSPTKISPAESASKVISHEREHYFRESAKAENSGKEVVSNNIRIFNSVCPECGKTYVAGGETTTVTRQESEQAEMAKKFFDEKVGRHMPQMLDTKV